MTQTADEIFTYPENEAGLQVIPRRVFFRHHFHHQAGQHIVFGGPSTRGKTTAAFDALDEVATPDLPAYIAVSKPRDKVTTERGKQLGARFVNDWPAPKKLGEIFGEKPRAYIVWPKFGDLHTDMQNAAEITSRLIQDRYREGVHGKKAILVMDDTMVKAKVMNLDGEMVTVLAMASAMDISLWTMVQKPTDSGRTPIWAYTMSTHKFLTHDPVETSRRRYAQIADMDYRELTICTSSLTEYQQLYVHRDEGWMCVVDKG